MLRRIGISILFFLFVILFFSDSTDADLFVTKTVAKNVWAATTLDFSKRDTANNQPTISLFNVINMIPGGFQVNSLRIKNEGKSKFLYYLSTKQISGDKNLYDGLNIRIMNNWVTKYDGQLKDVDISMECGDNDDWILVLQLNKDVQDLSQKELRFNFVLRTSREIQKKGFFVEGEIENYVSTGIWR